MHIAFAFNLQTSRCESEAEYDTAATVSMIADALARLGHQVSLVDVGDDLAAVVDRLRRLSPDLVFNTAEGKRGRGREALFPAIFDHLGLAYTGSDPLACALTLDKQRTKEIVAAAGVDVARGFVVRSLDDIDLDFDRFPAIVKPNAEGSSVGIDDDSIVDNHADLARLLEARLGRFDSLLVEELIDGMDVVVPFLEAASPETGGILEPASYRYTTTDRSRALYNYAMKLDGFSDLIVDAPARIGPRERALAIDSTRRAIAALEIRDVGRLDFRLGRDGRVVFLEANALPSLETGASLYLCGALAGLDSVDAVIDAVIASAARRCGIEIDSCHDGDRANDHERAT